MRVVARRREGYTHEVEIEGGHTLVIDEPRRRRRRRPGPLPHPRRRRRRSPPARRSPARCTPSARAGSWARSRSRSRSSRASGSAFEAITVTLRVPEPLDDEQRERLLVIAGKCPVHRALLGRDRGRDRTTGSSRAGLMDLGPRRQGLRGHRRQPRDRPRDRAHALRRGRLGAAGRARRRARSPRPRRACREAAPASAGAERARARRHRRRRRRAHRRRGRESASARLDVLVNNAGTARWRDLDEVPERRLVRGLGAERDGAAAGDAGRDPGDGRARLGPDRQRLLDRRQAPSAQMPEYSVAKAAELSLSRLLRRPLRRATGCS